MIKVEGTNIDYEGSLALLFAEATAVLHLLYLMTCDEVDEEFAKESVIRCTELALMDAKELRERAKKLMKEKGIPEDFLSKAGDTHVN